MKKKLAVAALLLAAISIPFVVVADTPVAGRVGPGAQMTCNPAVPTHVSTRGVVWCNSGDANKLHYTDPSGADITVGGGVTWPLQNGNATNTYNSNVADGAAARGHSFDTTNAFVTDGDFLFRLRSAAADWFTAGRTNAARKFTFFGDADSTGSGPMLVKSTSSSAGLTLDASTAGGRIYQQYSTTAGLYVIADLTAGANRWQMDANGALAPYLNNSFNLGVQGTNEMADVYSVKVDTSSTISTNIASVTGQQASFQAIATTAATSAGTQSNSPGMLFRAQAWNTTALAGQAMDWLIQNVPTAGGANPVSGQLSFYSQANATGWNERFRITPTRATALNGMVVTNGLAAGYRTAATAITVTNADHFVGVTGTGARTVNLPAANTCLAGGQMFVIQEVGGDVGTITVNRASTDTINGATSITIAAAYGRKTLYCNGSNAWFASSATN